jgi:hypothetical protein
VSGAVGFGGFRVLQALFFFDPDPTSAIIRSRHLHLVVAVLQTEPGRRERLDASTAGRGRGGGGRRGSVSSAHTRGAVADGERLQVALASLAAVVAADRSLS